MIAPDMLETIWCAAVRRTKGGRELGKDMACLLYTSSTANLLALAKLFGISAEEMLRDIS